MLLVNFVGTSLVVISFTIHKDTAHFGYYDVRRFCKRGRKPWNKAHLHGPSFTGIAHRVSIILTVVKKLFKRNKFDLKTSSVVVYGYSV